MSRLLENRAPMIKRRLPEQPNSAHTRMTRFVRPALITGCKTSRTDFTDLVPASN